MNWGWIKKRKLSAFFIFLFFSLYGLLVRHLNIFSLVCVDRHGRAVVYRRQLTPEVCCSQDPLTFWYTLQHPQGQKNETRAPASSCPINCCRTSETVGQLPAPTWVSITGSDRSIWQEHCPADCPSSLSLNLHLNWPCSSGWFLLFCRMSKRARSHRGSANIL